MKITTPIYLEMLIKLKSDLEEIVYILGPIRKDSDEGQMGIKARGELKTLKKTIEELTSYKNAATMQSLQSSKLPSKISSKTLSTVRDDRVLSRRSLCLV